MAEITHKTLGFYLNSETGLPENQQKNHVDRALLTGFYTIFPDIKRISIRFLNDENSKNISYSKKPAVNVYDIATKLGLSISKEPGELINNKHARLSGNVIFLKEGDSKEEWLFSIAHEIFHFIFFKEEIRKLMPVIVEKKKIWEDERGEKNIEENKLLQEDLLQEKLRRKIPSWEDEMVARTNSKVEDEIADYFAANLCVPIERFVLWEHKSDKKIASAFGVPEKCIEKRREEIINELELMMPKNLSSGVNLDEMPQFSQGKLNHTLGGSNSNDTKQT